MSYTIEFRRLALEMYQSGRTVHSIADELSVSRTTLHTWIDKFKCGELQSQKPGPKGPRKYSEEALLEFIKKNPQAKLSEIGQKFDLQKSTTSLALKRMGIQRKATYEFTSSK